MKKLGKFPIENCNAEVEEIAVFGEGSDLEMGDTYCPIVQHFPDLDIEKTADGVRITCRENCPERKTG